MRPYGTMGPGPRQGQAGAKPEPSRGQAGAKPGPSRGQAGDKPNQAKPSQTKPRANETKRINW